MGPFHGPAPSGLALGASPEPPPLARALQELEHAEVEEELLGVAPVPSRLPAGRVAAVVKSAEELELEQLEAELLAA